MKVYAKITVHCSLFNGMNKNRRQNLKRFLCISFTCCLSNFMSNLKKYHCQLFVIVIIIWMYCKFSCEYH